MNNGKLLIFAAPSAAGKTTIVHHILDNFPNIEFSISAATRDKRDNEVDGKDYHFLSINDFKEKINNNEFLEWEQVYEGCYYGTLKSEIERIWNKGSHVIFDIDVVGGLNIKKFYKEKALSVFVMPPSLEVLEQRLRKRSTESEEKIKERIKKAKHELTYSNQLDMILLNDEIETTLTKAGNLVSNFLRNNFVNK